jgi:hypothetical protein
VVASAAEDYKSITILRNCRRAMGQGGKLLIVEGVVPPGNEPSASLWNTISILLLDRDKDKKVVDLLRFSILLLDRDKDKKVVGLLGEACEDTRATISIKSDDSGVNYMGSVVFHSFSLTRQTVEAMQQIGVFVLSDLLRKERLTEFEEVIFRAVHWLASAQAQFENVNRFPDALGGFIYRLTQPVRRFSLLCPNRFSGCVPE